MCLCMPAHAHKLTTACTYNAQHPYTHKHTHTHTNTIIIIIEVTGDKASPSVDKTIICIVANEFHYTCVLPDCQIDHMLFALGQDGACSELWELSICDE